MLEELNQQGKVAMSEITNPQSYIGREDYVGDELAVKPEPELWRTLEPVAKNSIAFWEAFLDLRKAGNVELGENDRLRLLRIVRAVCWVESKHGTGTGNEPARDPMQVGNPADLAWKQFAGIITGQDRYVRGPEHKTNYWADELPDAVVSDPRFPAGAKLTSLGDKKKGHNDAAFNPVTSIWWGVPHLIWKINKQAATRPCYLFNSLSRQELVEGAGRYNGGGDPDYKRKIDVALAEQGWPALLEQDFAGNAFASLESLGAPSIPLLFEELGRHVVPDGIFARGIAKITISITASSGANVSFIVEGPQVN